MIRSCKEMGVKGIILEATESMFDTISMVVSSAGQARGPFPDI